MVDSRNINVDVSQWDFCIRSCSNCVAYRTCKDFSLVPDWILSVKGLSPLVYDFYSFIDRLQLECDMCFHFRMIQSSVMMQFESVNDISFSRCSSVFLHNVFLVDRKG